VSAYRLTRKAQRDFEEIWAYSKIKWGARRAHGYLREIRAMIAMVAEHPDLSPIDEDLPEGCRKRTAGSHLVVYRRRGDFVEIVRILHQNMDVEGRFP
jgi:toxin ParE1/3/4